MSGGRHIVYAEAKICRHKGIKAFKYLCFRKSRGKTHGRGSNSYKDCECVDFKTEEQ